MRRFYDHGKDRGNGFSAAPSEPPRLQAKAGEVLIKIKAASLDFPDRRSGMQGARSSR